MSNQRNNLERTWPFGRPLYPGSTLVRCVCESAREFSRQRGTQGKLHTRRSPARYSFRMATKETNKHPWEIRPPFPLILEPLGLETRDREWPWTAKTIVCGQRPVQLAGRLAVSQQTVMSRESSGLLLGVATLESKRKRLSVSKGTREARSSKVIVQSLRYVTRQISPMRRSGGGVSVVVRDGSAVHMAKGDRMTRRGQQRHSTNRKGFR